LSHFDQGEGSWRRFKPFQAEFRYDPASAHPFGFGIGYVGGELGIPRLFTVATLKIGDILVSFPTGDTPGYSLAAILEPHELAFEDSGLGYLMLIEPNIAVTPPTLGAPFRFALNNGGDGEFDIFVFDEAHNLLQGASGALYVESGAISVPEPATWTLALLGFTGAAAALRHRRAAIAAA
jgi:hypothetical protein